MLQYQFKKNGVAIDGATDPTMSLSDITEDDNGRYTLDVTESVTGKKRTYGPLVVDGVSGVSGGVPASLTQLLFPGNQSPYYTEEEWPGYSHRLKDFSDGVGSLRDKRQPRCYDFDGTNDYVRTSISNTVQAFTIAGWVNPDSLASDYQCFSSLGASGNNFVSLFVNRVSSGDHFAGYITTTGGTTVLSHTSTLPTGAWSHVALTWSGSVLTLWLNGSAVASGATRGTRSFDSLTIGANGATTPQATTYLNGKIYDVWYLDKAADSDEIEYMLSHGSSGVEPTNVLVHYPMQEETGTTAYDIGPNALHGTHYNTTPATFHAVDSGVGYSFPNERGFSPCLTYLSGETASFYAAFSASSSIDIEFEIFIQSTSTAITLLSDTTSIGRYFGLRSASQTGRALWLGSGQDYETIYLDDVLNDDDDSVAFLNAVANGQAHKIRINGFTGASWSTFRVVANSAGSLVYSAVVKSIKFDTNRNGTWDYVIDYLTDTNRTLTIVPANSSNLDVFGSDPTFEGRCPNYGLIKDYAWQGDGAAVYVNLTGDESNFSVTAAHSGILLFKTGADIATPMNILATRVGTNDRMSIQTQSANLRTSYFNGSAVNKSCSILANTWYLLEWSWSGSSLTLTVNDVEATGTSGTTLPSTQGGWLFATNGTSQFSTACIAYLSVTTGGSTTSYHPIPGTRDVVKIVDGVASVLDDAVVGGTLGSLYTEGPGTWQSPAVIYGANWDGTGLYPAISPLNVTANKAPISLDVDRTGGTVAPSDYATNRDGYTAEEFDDVPSDDTVNKRLIETYASDRYGSAAVDISSNSYFGT